MTNRPDVHQVTALLDAWSRGERQALDRLMPLVQGELRNLAAGYLRKERRDHTLRPTALVHEAYLRLIDQKRVRWEDRAHFFGIAATLMRRILVDYARKKRAAKRGGPDTLVTLNEDLDGAKDPTVDVVALNDALAELEQLYPRQAKIVELKFFGGLGVKEVSAVLDISPATVKREWSSARAWLYHELHSS